MIHKVTPASPCNMHKTILNRSSACTVARRQRSNSWNAIYSIGSQSKQSLQRRRKSASANTQTDHSEALRAFANQPTNTNTTTPMSPTIQAHGGDAEWLVDFEVMLGHLREEAKVDIEVNEEPAPSVMEPVHEPMSALPPIRTLSAPTEGRRRPRHRRTRSILIVSPEDNQNLGDYSNVQSDKPQWQLDAECLSHFENVPFDYSSNNNNNKYNNDFGNGSIIDAQSWASDSSSSLLSDGTDSSCGTLSPCGSEYGDAVEPQDEDPTFDGEDADSSDEYEEVVTKRRKRRGSTRRRSYHENIEPGDSYDASTWALSSVEGRTRLPSLGGHEYVGLFLPTIDEE